MKIAPTNRHGFWVQMTLNLGHVVNPSFLAHQAHRDEPGRNAQNANKDYGFSGVRFKVQNGFKIGSLNPVRFMGPRPYIWAWIVNLALFNPAHWRDLAPRKHSSPPSMATSASAWFHSRVAAINNFAGNVRCPATLQKSANLK